MKRAQWVRVLVEMGIVVATAMQAAAASVDLTHGGRGHWDVYYAVRRRLLQGCGATTIDMLSANRRKCQVHRGSETGFLWAHPPLSSHQESIVQRRLLCSTHNAYSSC
jgi:hypothetical protein